jgi:hypothetical protein
MENGLEKEKPVEPASAKRVALALAGFFSPAHRAAAEAPAS